MQAPPRRYPHQVEQATGIDLVYQSFSQETVTMQFQLMIASGDWPDIANVGQYYTGGVAQAYLDDVILDLTPLLADNMPMMSSHLREQDGVAKYNLQTDGMYLGVPSFNQNAYYDEGYFVRGDWLQAQGYTLEDMADFSSFEDYLRRCVDAYGCDYTFYLDTNGVASCLEGVFNTAFYQLQGTSLNLFVSEDGETLQTPLTSDGYRAYLHWLVDMISCGVVNQDFYAISYGGPERQSIIGNNKSAAFTARADQATEFFAFAVDESFTLEPISAFTGADGKYSFATTLPTTEVGYSVFADVENAGLILQFLDYFYSDAGIQLRNYGIQGLSFDYDADGKVFYTQAITANPNNWTTMTALKYYAPDGFGSVNDATRYFPTYSAFVLDTIAVWSDPAVYSSNRTTGKGFSLSTAGTDATTNELVDICAIADEALLKFISGAVVLNDETWDAYKANLADSGLGHVMEVYQNEYESYLADVAALQ